MKHLSDLHSFAVAVTMFVLAAMNPFLGAQGMEKPRSSATALITAPDQIFRTFHRISVRSGTVYMKNEQMQDALRRQSEFASWQLQAVNDPSGADLILQINRPLMTFDWVYKLMDARTDAVVLSGKVTGFDGAIASSRIAWELMQHIRVLRPMAAVENSTITSVSAQPMGTSPASEPPADVLRQCKSVFVRSTTIYLQDDMLKAAFRDRPEFVAWGLGLSPTPDSAEIVIEIARPVFTFDWTYKVTERRAGAVLLSGKVVAWDGRSAAPKLAASIVDLMRVSRPTSELVRGSVQVRQPILAGQSWPVEGVLIGSIGSNEVQIIHISESEARGRLNLTPDEITISSGERTAVRIPATSVVAISYEIETTNTGPADAYWRFWDEAFKWAESDPETTTGAVLALAPIMFGGSVIPELQKKRHHDVSILYLSNEGKVQRVRFEVPKAHRELLTALQTATAIEWTDLTKAAEELRKGPESHLIHQGELVTDRELQLGQAKLPADKYSILLLPKDDLRGEIFVFAGEVTTEPLTRADVEIQGVPRGMRGIVSATYSLRSGTNMIDEIDFGGRVIRLVAAR